MKVYVIEKGYYSDRHIIGIVETKDEAEQIVDAIKGASWDRDSVRYKEFDTEQFKNKRLLFEVTREWNNSWHAEFDEYNFFDNYKDNTCDYSDHYIIYADNPSQAIKIAQDMYWEEQAKKEGLI